jgi:hypothetical protein
MSNSFEIGQWVELIEGIGQVIYVRENFVEKFTEEYFEGKKVGAYIYDVVVCKLLCDFNGKIRKKNRVVAVRGGSGWLDSLGHSLSGAWRVADYAAVSRVVRLS